MSINREQLSWQLDLLREQYALLEQWQSIPKADFIDDPMKHRAVLHTLQLAIEGCLNIGNQLVSQLQLGTPNQYADIIDLLSVNEVLDQDFATELKQMVRFRNRIVHIYWDVDLGEVYQILQERIDDFVRFSEAIEAFVSTQED